MMFVVVELRRSQGFRPMNSVATAVDDITFVCYIYNYSSTILLQARLMMDIMYVSLSSNINDGKEK